MASDEGGPANRISSTIAAANPLAATAAPQVGTPAELPPGARIDRYLVLKTLGRGGMGVVYLAYDEELDRKVALKLLARFEGEAASSGGSQRMLREAQAMARLSHPNVVAVYDVGTFEGQVFLAMEYVEGVTLRDWAAAKKHSLREILGVYVQAGRGLEAAHAQGIFHRDFKPDNVVVDARGRPRVVDFGLAKVAPSEHGFTDIELAATRLTSSSGRAARSQPLTIVGALLGTPAYMSPEQLRGETADAASDQFAFCVSLYEALYGERPFEAMTLLELREAVAAQRFRPPPAGARVPRGVRAAILRGLRAASAERFATIGGLLGVLEQAGRARWRGQAALASLAVLFAVGVALVNRTPRPPPACAGADAEVARAWNADTRERVRAAFAASGNPRAQESLRLVESVLDAYATGWATMRTQACEATRVRGVQSDEALDLRTACLDQRRAELETTVSLLASADAKLVDHAVATVRALTPLDRCADVPSLRAPFAEPGDPEARRAADDARAQIARATALSNAQHLEEAIADASAAAATSKQAANRALEGSALLQKAIALAKQGKMADSLAASHDAALAADVARDDVTEAQAWTQLVFVVAMSPELAKDADLYADLAEAAIARAGNGDALQVELLKRRGDYLWAQDRIDDACTTYRNAVALSSKVHGEDSPITAGAEIDVASCDADADHLASAIAMLRQVLAVQQAAYGESSTVLGKTLYPLAFAELRLGDAEGALRDAQHLLATGVSGTMRVHARFTAARAMIAGGAVDVGLDEAHAAIAEYEGAYGASNWHAGSARDQLAETLVRRHLDDAALGTCQEAIAVLTAAKGDPDSLAEAREFRAMVLARRGQGAAAVRALSDVPRSTSDFNELLARGEVALASRDFARSVETLEAAVALADSSEGLPELHADAHLALARAVAGSHGDLERARDLAGRAAREYEGAGLTALAREATTSLPR